MEDSEQQDDTSDNQNERNKGSNNLKSELENKYRQANRKKSLYLIKRDIE